jgi:hypothetical protein
MSRLARAAENALPFLAVGCSAWIFFAAATSPDLIGGAQAVPQAAGPAAAPTGPQASEFKRPAAQASPDTGAAPTIDRQVAAAR